MTRTELARSEDELEVANGLHAVTVPLGRPEAQDLAMRAIALCTTISGHLGNGVFFSSPRRLTVTLGTAARLSVPGGTSRQAAARAISRFVASVPCTDPVGRPGSSTIAIGALPFDPRAAGQVVVPELTIASETDGMSWMTLVGTGQLVAPDLSSGSLLWSRVRDRRSAADESDSAEIAPLVEGDESVFKQAVTRALAEIAQGNLEKVVLARKVSASFGELINIEKTLLSLKSREPSSTVFAVVAPGSTFIGASPELLVAREGPNVTSVPLAGTVRLTGVLADDETAVSGMVESSKENLEHRLVVDDVVASLTGMCGDVEAPADPEVICLRQVAHLATRLSASLVGDPETWPSALELAAALHPTPAVGGFPTESALELIRNVEPAGRGFYAGPVGWVDADGDGEFVIGIRSAEVRGASASVYAGAGIVAGSDPSEELAETTVKLETMLGALSTG